MSCTTTFDLSVFARMPLASPVSGRGGARFAYGAEWESGTSSLQADIATVSEHTISASSNVDIDLRALVATDGTTANGAELAMLIIDIPEDASGTVTLTDSSSNGLALFGGTTPDTDFPAGHIEMRVWRGTGHAMSASAKSINLANAGASAVTVMVHTLQRSA